MCSTLDRSLDNYLVICTRELSRILVLVDKDDTLFHGVVNPKGCTIQSQVTRLARTM